MNAYERMLLRIEEEAIESGEWLGEDVDMRDRSREEILSEFEEYLKSSTLPEKEITTDVKNPEGIPGFVLEMEKDVYEEGYTVIN